MVLMLKCNLKCEKQHLLTDTENPLYFFLQFGWVISQYFKVSFLKRIFLLLFLCFLFVWLW